MSKKKKEKKKNDRKLCLFLPQLLPIGMSLLQNKVITKD